MKVKSIRPFIGAKNYLESIQFYLDIGFKELKTSPKLSYFYFENFGFYLQDYNAKEWIENTMIFLEVVNLEKVYDDFKNLNLIEKYPNSKLKPIVKNEWGQEFFLHDPSNILWHIGEFKN